MILFNAHPKNVWGVFMVTSSVFYAIAPSVNCISFAAITTQRLVGFGIPNHEIIIEKIAFTLLPFKRFDLLNFRFDYLNCDAANSNTFGVSSYRLLSG